MHSYCFIVAIILIADNIEDLLMSIGLWICTRIIVVNGVSCYWLKWLMDQ